jgi:outer membrane protein TolC
MFIRLLPLLFCAGLAFAAPGDADPVITPAPGDAPASTPVGGKLDPMLEKAKNVLDGVESVPARDDTLPAAPADALELDAKRCVELALSQNPKAGQADAAVDERAAQVGAAKSARLPQVKATAGANYTPGLQTDIGIPKILESLVPIGSFMPDKLTASAGVGVEQVLYAGGTIKAGIRASEFLARSEEWKRRAVLLDLAFEARQAFFDAAAARGLVAVAQDSISAYERHLTDAKTKLEQGMASKFEVLRAETELRARESDLESALTAEKLTMLNLRRLLALPGDQPVRLIGDFIWDPLNVAVDTLVAEARQARPELAALDAAVAAAGENVAMKEGAFRPRAAAKAGYQVLQGSGQMMPDGLNVSVGAEWSIYAGGRRKADVAVAKAQLRSLELQRADVDKLVEIDVRQAYDRANDAIARIRKDKAARALGVEGMELAELRFQQGAGIQADTLDAELALSTAETSLVQSLRVYAVALAGIDRAVGRPPLGAEGVVGPEPSKSENPAK